LADIEAGPGAAAPEIATLAVEPDVVLRLSVRRPKRSLGRPFFLLHGLAATARSWDGVAGRLVLAGHEVYALDFRGHGQSDRPESGYDLATFAADAAAVVAGLGLERPILVGHSLGANVILEILAGAGGAGGASTAMPEPGGVALIEGGLVGSAGQFATLDECLAHVELPWVGGMPLARVAGYLRQSNPGWSEARLGAALAAFDVAADGTVAWRLTAPRFEALLRSLWDQDVALAWPALRAPTLFLAADTGDAPWTSAKAASEAEVRRLASPARVEWLKGDHDIHADRPDEVAALLLETFGVL
jgi:pimeloyl-ACP methyl ester carboxylesterase